MLMVEALAPIVSGCQVTGHTWRSSSSSVVVASAELAFVVGTALPEAKFRRHEQCSGSEGGGAVVTDHWPRSTVTDACNGSWATLPRRLLRYFNQFWSDGTTGEVLATRLFANTARHTCEWLVPSAWRFKSFNNLSIRKHSFLPGHSPWTSLRKLPTSLT